MLYVFSIGNAINKILIFLFYYRILHPDFFLQAQPFAYITCRNKYNGLAAKLFYFGATFHSYFFAFGIYKRQISINKALFFVYPGNYFRTFGKLFFFMQVENSFGIKFFKRVSQQGFRTIIGI